MSIPYTVQPGDTLRLIAMKHGIKTWQEIYFHPDNVAFRTLRPNPDLIFPGDVIMIPSPAPAPPPPVIPPPPPMGLPPVEISELITNVRKWLGGLPVGVVGVKLPTAVRFLDPAEQSEGMRVYGGGLDFTKILLSDGLGGGGRPFTIVESISVGTFVVMNMGTLGSFAPSGAPPTRFSPSTTLVHELAHAWQSQHHPNSPGAFISNSVASQTGAIADVPAAKAAASARALASGRNPIAAASDEDVSAYAYVPGKPFGDYAAEQIAEQVENAYIAGTLATDPIVAHVRVPTPNVADADNLASLSTPRFERKSSPGVVFP
ncbi:MAG: LysM domain-containing protein [Isosphaeraceae bacterium]